MKPVEAEGYHDINKKIYHILVPLANPKHEIPKLMLAGQLVKNIGSEGEVTTLNIIEIPEQLPYHFLQTENPILKERKKLQEQMLSVAAEFGEKEGVLVNPKILYSHDKFTSIQMVTRDYNFDFLLLGWSDSFSGNYNSTVRRLARNSLSPVGVLKDNGLKEIKKVLIPFRASDEVGQGMKLMLEFVSRTNIETTIFTVISPESDIIKEKKRVQKALREYIEGYKQINIKIIDCKNPGQKIIEEAESDDYDLIVFGASKRLLVKARLINSIPHQVGEKVTSSVLIVYSPGK